MPRKRIAKKKITALVYRRGSVTVRHVDMPADQLPTEITRLSTVAQRTLRFLKPLPAHPTIQHARFKLERLIETATVSDVQDRQISEIGRLNMVLSDALTTLDRMTSKNRSIDQARFALKYGQTSRKRETGWNSFPKNRENEYLGDPEDPVAAND